MSAYMPSIAPKIKSGSCYRSNCDTPVLSTGKHNRNHAMMDTSNNNAARPNFSPATPQNIPPRSIYKETIYGNHCDITPCEHEDLYDEAGMRIDRHEL